MKRLAKMFAVMCVAALALSVVSASGASAAPKFTASATGTLSGTQTSSQTFTVTSGSSNNVVCAKASTSGSIVSVESAEQEVTVNYSECVAHVLGSSIAATVSPATYNLTANGTVHILNTITIHIGGIANCNIVVGPQTPTGSVTYTNKSGKIEQSSAVTGIVSTSTGFCPSGTTGTYSGSNLAERVGGGTISWDAS